MEIEIYKTLKGKILFNKFYFAVGTNFTKGTVASVSFDAESVIQNRKNVIGFYHTHPSFMIPEPSQTDINTMEGWTLCLGKPLLCIIGNNDERLVKAYYFLSDEEPYVDVKVRKLNNIFIGIL